MTDHIFTLKDCRKLGYALYGPGDGAPVFYFHGTPSSRLELLMLNAFGKYVDELCIKLNLHVIAVDRPGMGNSTFNPTGNFLSFAKDLSELATELKIVSAASLSWSSGGPYALSQAYHFPNLIKRVDIITGFTKSFNEKEVFKNMTSNKLYFGAAKKIPWLLRPVMKQQGSSPGKKPFPRWLSKAPEPDYNLMQDHEERMIAFSRCTTMEAVKNGSKGVVYEAQRYFDPSGYVIKEMTQPIHFWWGTEDNVVQYVHAEAIKEAPNHHLHIKQNEGHITIWVNYMEEILQSISSCKK